jgi:hypothetical protein
MYEGFAGFLVELLGFKLVDEKVDKVVLLLQLVEDLATVVEYALLALEIGVQAGGQAVFERLLDSKKVFYL